jgi:hybrid cluster-associated redox disulfide protein
MAIGVNEITEDICVDDLITELPETAQVFVRRRMSCVGCDIARFETLADVCRVYRQPIDELLEEIRKVLRQSSST